MLVTAVLIVTGAVNTVDKGLIQCLEDLKISGDPNSSLMIDHYTEKSPGELRGHDVTSSPVRNYRLTLL